MTFVRINQYTDFAIEILVSNRRLTDTLRQLQHEVFTCFRLLAAITQYVNKSEGKWILHQVCRCFPRVLESYDCWTKFDSSPGMEYNGELYWFSAVKMNEVSGYFDLKTIYSRLNSSTDADNKTIWHMCEFLFWTIRSLNFQTFIDALCNKMLLLI